MKHIIRPAFLSAVCSVAVLAPGVLAQGSAVERTWSDACASCHADHAQGASGKAKTLLDDAFTGVDAAAIDRRFFESIKSGHKDKGINADGKSLTDEQCWMLTNFIREFQARERRERVGVTKPVAGTKDEYASTFHRFKIETVVEKGLSTPWSVDFLPDGAKPTMLVTERSGRVRTVREGKLSEPITSLPKTLEVGQGGYLDIAVHPEWKKNGWVYLAYAEPRDEGKNSPTMTKIVRGKLTPGEGNKPWSWTDQQTIFEAKKEHYLATGLHFGCRIVFDASDKDGRRHVFFGIGERGRAEFAQDLTRPNGKIYRLWDDGTVPDDNPYASGNEDRYRAIWTFGHRNPQGLAIDNDGRLWDTEHGPRGGDELNLIEPGRNYGWPTVSYGMNYNGSPLTVPWPELKGLKVAAKPGDEGLTLPVWRWLPSIAACGLDVVRKAPAKSPGAFTQWEGDLLAGGLAGLCLERLRIRDGKLTAREEILYGLGRVRDVVCGPDGTIYVVLNGPDKIIRLVAMP